MRTAKFSKRNSAVHPLSWHNKTKGKIIKLGHRNHMLPVKMKNATHNRAYKKRIPSQLTQNLPSAAYCSSISSLGKGLCANVDGLKARSITASCSECKKRRVHTG